MNEISRLADKRPLAFGLLALLTWIVLNLLIAAVAAFLLKASLTTPYVQVVSTLGATCILLWLVSRLGGFGKLGITNFGTWSTWVITLLVAVYVVLVGWYAFFGETSFEFRSLVDTHHARLIVLQQLPVGFVEETVFRGIILFALVRVWGQTKRGLVAAVH